MQLSPAWPQLFAREATRIKSILGDTAIRLAHKTDIIEDILARAAKSASF